MRWSDAWHWAVKRSNVLFFVGGFVFDAITLKRIDSVLDLLFQAVYLLVITVLLVWQSREELGLWTVSPRLAKLWHHNVEALHFCYGGLLSSYVIFYSKSSSFSRSSTFLLLVVLLMFANEMPQVKKAGSTLRLGLHAFCIGSYLNYLLPVLLGYMNMFIFFLALSIAGGFSFLVVRLLAGFYVKKGHDRRKIMVRLGWPPALVLMLLAIFYVMKWIPPVPLSLQFGGVFHHVEKVGDRYELSYPKPKWFIFWRKDSTPFRAAPGDAIFCFVRIFAPTRFSHRVFMDWKMKTPSGYRSTDHIPLEIAGGREEGYRGFTAKSRFDTGDWRVDVETDDGRIIGSIPFEVVPETSLENRQWRQRVM